MKCSPLFEVRQTQHENISAKPATGNPTPWTQELRTDLNPQPGDFPSLYGSDALYEGVASGSNGYGVGSLGTNSSPGNSHVEGSGSHQHSNQPTPSSSTQNSSYTSPPKQAHGLTQGQPSPSTYAFASQSGAWDVNATLPYHGVAETQPIMNIGNAGMSAGRTGMTPMPDSIWPNDGIGDGNEWMFGWTGQTPQP
jgi:hypothetical protein